MREFRLPEGTSPADLDAASDPQSGLLVVLDLRGDDSLQAAGLAREVRHKKRGNLAAGLASSIVVGYWSLCRDDSNFGLACRRLPACYTRTQGLVVSYQYQRHKDAGMGF